MFLHRLLASVIVVACLAVPPGHCGSVPYTAAVVEYAPYTVPAPVNTSVAQTVIHTNLAAYKAFASEAAAKGAGIIVFPEDGLFGFLNCNRTSIAPYTEALPQSPVGRVPCDSPTEFGVILQTASCMARANAIVVVIDLATSEPCLASTGAVEPCFYNTQVAIDKDGAILAKFLKYHLFFEPQYDRPPAPQTVTFDALGVRFGMMVCFGAMFADPSQDLKAAGANDVVFSSWWVNTPPTVWSTQYYQAWSRVYDATLLAAGGVSSPAWTYSGSGVFQQGNALAAEFNTGTAPTSKLLVVHVPASSPVVSATTTTTSRALSPAPPQREGQVSAAHCSSNTTYSRVPALSPANHPHAGHGEWGWEVARLVDGASGSVTASSGDVTCTASYAVSSASPGSVYGILAYDGAYDGAYNESSCFFVVCLSAEDCSSTTAVSTAVFTSVKVVATYGGTESIVTPFPVVGADLGTLLPAKDVEYSVTEYTATTATVSPSSLISVGVLGPQLHHIPLKQ